VKELDFDHCELLDNTFISKEYEKLEKDGVGKTAGVRKAPPNGVGHQCLIPACRLFIPPSELIYKTLYISCIQLCNS
jgi:hypothetical protein